MNVESLTKEELMFVKTIIGGPPSAIEVKVCVLCGAIVFDTERHYEHHQSVPLWRSYDSDPEPEEPTLIGWYRSKGGNYMLYSLSEGLEGKVWHAHMMNGEVATCTWSYVRQSWPLEAIGEQYGR